VTGEYDPLCSKCEEVMQPYLDGALSDVEIAEAQAHLDRCGYCARRYRFEVHLRRFVRQATVEPMPLALKQRLLELRTPLVGP
jgi:mycothiol system anti-sigma-R factor